MFEQAAEGQQGRRLAGGAPDGLGLGRRDPLGLGKRDRIAAEGHARSQNAEPVDEPGRQRGSAAIKDEPDILGREPELVGPEAFLVDHGKDHDGIRIVQPEVGHELDFGLARRCVHGIAPEAGHEILRGGEGALLFRQDHDLGHRELHLEFLRHQRREEPLDPIFRLDEGAGRGLGARRKDLDAGHRQITPRIRLELGGDFQWGEDHHAIVSRRCHPGRNAGRKQE